MLDIQTERGQQTLADEVSVARYIESQHGVHYVRTDKDSPAIVDAILLMKDDMRIAGLVETKCRYDVTEHEFDTRYGCEWLMTWAKLEQAIKLAASLCTPLIGMLYLKRSNRLLVQRICSPDGLLSAPIRLATTETQATCNGGKATRVNGYISMRNARRFDL